MEKRVIYFDNEIHIDKSKQELGQDFIRNRYQLKRNLKSNFSLNDIKGIEKGNEVQFISIQYRPSFTYLRHKKYKSNYWRSDFEHTWNGATFFDNWVLNITTYDRNKNVIKRYQGTIENNEVIRVLFETASSVIKQEQATNRHKHEYSLKGRVGKCEFQAIKDQIRQRIFNNYFFNKKAKGINKIWVHFKNFGEYKDNEKVRIGVRRQINKLGDEVWTWFTIELYEILSDLVGTLIN